MMPIVADVPDERAHQEYAERIERHIGDARREIEHRAPLRHPVVPPGRVRDEHGGGE